MQGWQHRQQDIGERRTHTYHNSHLSSMPETRHQARRKMMQIAIRGILAAERLPTLQMMLQEYKNNFNPSVWKGRHSGRFVSFIYAEYQQSHG
jgi:hypothetical protein